MESSIPQEQGGRRQVLAWPGHGAGAGEKEVSRGGGGGKGRKVEMRKVRGGEAGRPCGLPHLGAPHGHAHQCEF